MSGSKLCLEVPADEELEDHCVVTKPASVRTLILLYNRRRAHDQMSQEDTERTKLGPGLKILDVSGTPTTVYHNEEEMEDTAPSSVKLVGETVPNSYESSLGLSPQNPITSDSLRNVTGSRMAEMWNVSDAAQQATDAAEQRAVAAQDLADVVQQKQEHVENEKHNTDRAFREEQRNQARDTAAANQKIVTLQMELNDANTKINAQGAVVQNVAGLGSDLREAQQRMATQTAEMRNLGNVTDEMIEQVGELTDAFHQIDAERTRENLVHQNVVNSVPVHVQDTHHHVNEPAGHVQSVPTPNVMHLVSQDTGNRQEAAPQEDDVRWLGVDGYGLGGRPAATPNAASTSYYADLR